MIVYKTTNLVNGKIYIGRDVNNSPHYLGSGMLFIRALKKYGKENFVKEVIDVAINIDDLNEKEIFWIAYYKSQDPNIGYNIQKGGGSSFHCLSYEQQEEIRKKAIERNRERKFSEETKQKMRNSMLGKNTGKRNDETREKMSQNRKGKGIGNDPWNKGKEVGAKLSTTKSGEKNPMWGKKHSEETKQKIREKSVGRAAYNRGISLKEYAFFRNEEIIYIAKGQREAIEYCKKNNLPYSILIKKLLSWNEYKVKPNYL